MGGSVAARTSFFSMDGLSKPSSRAHVTRPVATRSRMGLEGNGMNEQIPISPNFQARSIGIRRGVRAGRSSVTSKDLIEDAGRAEDAEDTEAHFVQGLLAEHDIDGL